MRIYCIVLLRLAVYVVCRIHKPPSGRDLLIIWPFIFYGVVQLESQNIIHMFNNNFNNIIIIMVIWSYIITNDQIKLFLLSFFLLKLF